MKQILFILIIAKLIFAVTGDDIINKYSLANPQFSEKDFDESVCSNMAESTFTYYNKLTGLIDSQYHYVNNFNANRVLKHYYDHKIFDDGTRVAREFEVAVKGNDTLRKALQAYNNKGLKTEIDRIHYDYPGHEKEIYTYNNRNQETAYYCIHIRSDGSFDTTDVHKTTYDNKGRPVSKVFPKANGRTIFKYTDFDSIAAELSISKGKELPYIIYFYNQNKRVKSLTEYMWLDDTLPPQRSIYYFYDSLGRLTKSYYFSSCTGLGSYSGPGSFCLNAVEYVKFDSKGREVEHYQKVRPDDKYKD